VFGFWQDPSHETFAAFLEKWFAVCGVSDEKYTHKDEDRKCLIDFHVISDVIQLV
jgi:hypothetical protein